MHTICCRLSKKAWRWGKPRPSWGCARCRSAVRTGELLNGISMQARARWWWGGACAGRVSLVHVPRSAKDLKLVNADSACYTTPRLTLGGRQILERCCHDAHHTCMLQLLQTHAPLHMQCKTPTSKAGCGASETHQGVPTLVTAVLLELPAGPPPGSCFPP